MKVGLIGESPNDTFSIQTLLKNEYSAPDFEFIFLIDRIHGSQLDSQKTKRFLRIEYESKQPDLVIFIRDLDGLASNIAQYRIRREYFTSFNSVIDKKGIYLLNIYEIEALILSDIETFNRFYKSNLELLSDPMLISEPKEFITSRVKSYSTSDNPNIFGKLRWEALFKNCKYFNEFIVSLNTKIGDLNK